MCGTGSSGRVLSRQCALVFSQKMIAAMLPAFAAANKKPDIVALASAVPRSRSSRKRLRNVFGAQPMSLAMSSCGTPRPAKYRTLSRKASVAPNACLAMFGSQLSVDLSIGAFRERLARVLMFCSTASESLPALHDHIDVTGVELEAVANAAGHFGG